jgi:hypothetical protein
MEYFNAREEIKRKRGDGERERGEGYTKPGQRAATRTRCAGMGGSVSLWITNCKSLNSTLLTKLVNQLS